MSVRLFYVDESFDNDKFCLSAISIIHRDWKDCFAKIRQHRALLKQTHGLYLRKEIHARDFVKGKGQIAPHNISKHDRCKIFEGLLSLVASLPNVLLFNVCLDAKGHTDVELTAWNRLLNRIERTLLALEDRELLQRKRIVAEITGKISAASLDAATARINTYKPRALIFADEGKEVSITRTFRKMNVFNPVPSRWGAWADGSKAKNFPVERVIEDPIFKKSDQSFFIQLADCVAFALLKREVKPTPHVQAYGLNLLFDKCLAGACFRQASPADPLGIVRK